jgi:hypothetical protein
MEEAVHKPEPNEQVDVEISVEEELKEEEEEHNCLGKDHHTEQVQQKEEEPATERAEEKEQVTGLRVQESAVVQGYRSFVRLVRLDVRSIVGYSS